MPSDAMLRAARAAAEAERRREGQARALAAATWPKDVTLYDPECPSCDGTGQMPGVNMGDPSEPCPNPACRTHVAVVPLSWLAER